MTIVSGHTSDKLKKMGAIYKPREELKKWVDWADLVVVASGDPQLNQEVTFLSEDKLLNRADYPEEGNLIVPSSFYIGDIQFSIFTQGKSHLMAKELRKFQSVVGKKYFLLYSISHASY